uniref:Nuclear pore complex protein n=1 Tax=Schistocephalus solidus TaxID=70667 RepID=A0A183SQ45_SCHSO
LTADAPALRFKQIYLHLLSPVFKAQRLCKLRGEFWRAAAMDGWRTFHCPTFTNNEKENENRNNGVTEEQMVEGNPNRILSKMVSWWNAENPKINPHERAIYAALSGNLSALLQALKSECWDDVLWAHCCAMVESRVDAGIRSLLNCGPRTDTMSVLGEPHPVWGSEAGLGLPDSAWSYGSWSLLECFTKTETVLGWSPTEFLHRVSTSSIDGDCQTSFVQPTTKVSAMADFLGRSSTPVLESSQSSRPSDPLLLKAFFYATCRGLALGEFSGNQFCFCTGKDASDPVTSPLQHTTPYSIDSLRGLSCSWLVYTRIKPCHLYLLDTMSSIVPLLVPQPIQQILQSHITHANSAVLADSLSLNPLYCHVLRFMAHLVICLQHLEPDLPDHQCTRVLEAYIATLIAEQRLPLVAHYTACLSSPALQTQWYAAFLSGKALPSLHGVYLLEQECYQNVYWQNYDLKNRLKKPEDREQCLAYGIEAGLNLRSITRAVVRTMRYRFGQLDQEQQQQQPPSPPSDISQPRPTATSRSHPLPAYGDTQIITLVGRDVADLLTPLDRSRIAAIDWLVYDKSQRGEALVLANSLLRLFIAMRKLQAARSVLDRLPMAILDQLKLRLEAREDEEEGGGPGTNLPLWLENSVREHECLLLYLQAHEAYASWYEHLHSSRPSPPTTELGASRLLADRMAAEEAQRIYEARLDCWQHEVNLSTSLHYPQHGVDAEDSGPIHDFSVRDPVLPNQLQYSAEAAEIEVIQLPGLVRVDGPGLRSLCVVDIDSGEPYSALGGGWRMTTVLTALIVNPKLAQPAVKRSMLICMSSSVTVLRAQSSAKSPHAPLHVLLRHGVKGAVVREEQVRRHARCGLHTPTVVKVPVGSVCDAHPRVLITVGIHQHSREHETAEGGDQYAAVAHCECFGYRRVFSDAPSSRREAGAPSDLRLLPPSSLFPARSSSLPLPALLQFPPNSLPGCEMMVHPTNFELLERPVSLISQLEGLLTYEYPGWLVDVCVRTNTQAAEMDDLDLTGMVGPDPDGEENGIAGLGETVHSRRLQMSVLRESCLREVVFMLVNVYRSTGRHMDCVRVADLVAEKEYGLYKVSSAFIIGVSGGCS